MKIVMVAPDYAPKGGGVEKHILHVVRELRARGHEVVVLVRWGDYLPEHQVVEGVAVWRLPRSNSLPSLLWWYVRHRDVVAGAAVVHSHDFYPRWLRRLGGRVRWVHTFHGYEGWPLDQGAIASRRALRAEVATCIGVGAFIEKWYGTKLDYVTYGAAAAPAGVAAVKDGPEIVFVGRLEEDTGFRTYLEAFKLIHARHPKARMAVLGDGSLREWAEEFVAEHKLPVAPMQWVDEPLGYVRAAKVMLVSGYLAILEAAAVGKPVVAHYGTPIKRDYLACHPLAEDMVIASTAEEIAAGYERAAELSATKAGRERLAEAQAWAREQTWRRLVDLYERVYEGRRD
jgi:glycosyltransferase involved in cell wall biosynthesis